MQSRGFDAPRQAGEVIAAFQKQGAGALPALQAHLQPLPDVDAGELAPVLDQLIQDD